jgi:hypothetical protein
MLNWTGFERKWLWPIKVLSVHLPGGTRETHETPPPPNHGQDLNLAPPEYQLRPLSLCQSVWSNQIIMFMIWTGSRFSGFWHHLIVFNPEYGGSMFVQDIGILIQDHTVSQTLSLNTHSRANLRSYINFKLKEYWTKPNTLQYKT